MKNMATRRGRSMVSSPVSEPAIKSLSALQAEEVEVIEDAGRKLEKIKTETSHIEKHLRSLISRGVIDANEVAEMVRKYRIDTGKMSGRLVDEIENKSGQKIYPPKWRVEKTTWFMGRK